MTSSATWQRSRLRSAITTDSFSSASVTFPLRRMPAVSTSTYGRPRVLEGGVDRVARRAGLGVDQHALGADHRVDQRRLADVGPADDGQVHRVVRRGHAPGRAARGRGRPPASRPRRGRARPRRARARRSRAGRDRPARCPCPPVSILLATTTTVRPLRRSTPAISASSAVTPARASTHEEHEVGLVQRGQHLPPHALDQRLDRRGIEAAGVDHRGLPALEGDLAVEPVTGDAGDVAHDAPGAGRPAG